MTHRSTEAAVAMKKQPAASLVHSSLFAAGSSSQRLPLHPRTTIATRDRLEICQGRREEEPGAAMGHHGVFCVLEETINNHGEVWSVAYIVVLLSTTMANGAWRIERLARSHTRRQILSVADLVVIVGSKYHHGSSSSPCRSQGDLQASLPVGRCSLYT